MSLNLNNHQKAILALVAANIIWGAASPIFKWSLANIQPFTLAFLRFFFASLLLLPFICRNWKIRKEDWLNLILLTFSGVTFNISFFFLGLKLAPSINAPIIATAGPIFLLLGSFFFLKETLKKRIVLGTMLGLLGVILIVLRPLIENGWEFAVLGNFFFILATLGGVSHTLFVKKIIAHYEPVVLTFWAFFIGGLTFLPFFLYEINQYGFLPNLAIPGITGILFGIFLCSALAYFLFHWAIKQLLAQEVGVFTYLDPIIAIIIAYPLLGETPTPAYLLGSIFVFLGIFIAQGRIPYHPFQKLKEIPTQISS